MLWQTIICKIYNQLVNYLTRLLRAISSDITWLRQKIQCFYSWQLTLTSRESSRISLGSLVLYLESFRPHSTDIFERIKLGFQLFILNLAPLFSWLFTRIENNYKSKTSMFTIILKKSIFPNIQVNSLVFNWNIYKSLRESAKMWYF